MPRITATLNEGFVADIDYTAFEDVVSDLRVRCPVTGIDLTDLVAYSSTAWDQAWDAAERHLIAQPSTTKAQRAAANDMAAMCHDTPYRVAA